MSILITFANKSFPASIFIYSFLGTADIDFMACPTIASVIRVFPETTRALTRSKLSRFLLSLLARAISHPSTGPTGIVPIVARVRCSTPCLLFVVNHNHLAARPCSNDLISMTRSFDLQATISIVRKRILLTLVIHSHSSP